MSHTTEVKTVFTNQSAIAAACKELGLPAPVQGKARLYQPGEHEGTLIKLPGWSYPVIISKDGTAKYDNYHGAWGTQSELNKFSQAYAKHVTMATMRKQGYMVTQTKVGNKLILNCSK